MKKVLLLMFAVMLIVGLMAGPALASAPDGAGAFGHAIALHAQGGDRGAVVSGYASVNKGYSYPVHLLMDDLNWPLPHAE